MLHNTGTFDQNEVPINQNNQNNLSSESRNITSNNNISKTDLPAQMDFNVPFDNYQVNLGVRPYITGYEASAQNYQSGTHPMNFNIQNDYKGHAKNTLNLPRVFTKAYHKQMNIDYNYINSCKRSNYDVNHVNKSETQSVNESSSESIVIENQQNEDIRIGSNNTLQTEVLNNISQDSSYQIELDLSRKHVHNVNSDSIKTLSNKLLGDDSRKRLANTVKIIENIISHPSNSRKFTPENVESDISDDCMSETSYTDFTRESTKMIENNKNKKSFKSNINNRNKMEQITAKTESSLCYDSKFTGKDIHTSVKSDILNIEQYNHFLKDPHGIQGEETLDCNIIGAESSINVAKEIVRNGSSLIATLFECPHCKLFFNNAKRFLIHAKWHTFGYITEKKLRSQKEKILKPRSRKKCVISESNENTEDGVVSCGDCKKTFPDTQSLMDHRQEFHPTRLRECKICGKKVVGLAALRAHITTHTTESKFKCDDCPKWFKYAHSLAKHRDTHLEKTQECPQCPKKFGSIALLNVHMKTHERVLRGATFRCSYCGKGFYESHSLQAHERTHRNERPFICEICKTSFGTNSSLKRHLKVSHSTSKPFECTTCHRSFVSESIRDRHEIRYHGDPDKFKFICNMCPCKYLNARELRRHIYKVHPKPKMKIEVESD